MPEDKPNKPQEASKPSSPPQPESLDVIESKTEAAPATEPSSTQTAPGATKPVQKIRKIVNIYLVLFILLVGTGAAVVFVSLKPTKTVKETPIGKLTQDQLSALRSNSTVVGDPKQTLDIQSNTIFEGQVLARNDFSVAGSLKVGGSLSLPSITITGNGNFAQLGVTGPLSVGGDTALQGALTVQKNLSVAGTASFGSLSVGGLSVTSLQVKSDFSISKHIITSGGTPGQANGPALGSGGTASVSGSDTAGSVNINTGGSPPAGIFITISFNQRFSATPHVVITPVGAAAGSVQFYITRDANGFSIGSSNAPPAGSNFGFDYVVIQ
jgi:hypothetical protein